MGLLWLPQNQVKRKIIVAGAGIAGLQAAAIAAQKGHQVSVYKTTGHIGGQWYYASRNPWGKVPANTGTTEFMRWVNHMKAQCDKNGVKFVLNTPVNKELLAAKNPNSLVIATGAVPEVPAIPGIDKPHVVKMFDVFSGKATLGRNVVILGGSGAAISLTLFVLGRLEKQNVKELQRSND